MTDPFCLFDTIDAAEVVVPCADFATPTAPQPSTDVQFEPPRKVIQGFYTIMPAGKHVPRDGHRRNSKKAHIILAEITDSSFIPCCQSNPFQNECVKCWTPTSLAQRGVSDASKDGKVKTVLKRSLLCLDYPRLPQVSQLQFSI